MDILVVVFGLTTLLGAGYLVFSLVGGGEMSLFDGIDLGFIDGDGNFGCMVLAVFLAVFGGIGLLGTLSGWNVLLTLVIGSLVGILVGRATLGTLRFVMRQQSEPVRPQNLIGWSGRMTINTPAGKTGEAIFEQGSVTKYPVREVEGQALKQGDQVTVVELSGGILYVRRSE